MFSIYTCLSYAHNLRLLKSPRLIPLFSLFAPFPPALGITFGHSTSSCPPLPSHYYSSRPPINTRTPPVRPWHSRTPPVHPWHAFEGFSTEFKSMIDAEPRRSSDFDLSDAIFIQVDLSHLWGIDRVVCRLAMDFAYDCYYKSVLKMFYLDFGFPPYCILGVTQDVCTIPRRDLESFRLYALIAVTQYNYQTKDSKLRLEKILKVNVMRDTMSMREQYYMTFSAISEDTGKVGTYQAALRNCYYAWYVLGLFRDVGADKTLAIISIPGAEEFFAAKKKFEDR